MKPDREQMQSRPGRKISAQGKNQNRPGTSAGDDGPEGSTDHTPIIVTSAPESSASIQFSTREYAPVTGDPNTFEGDEDLFLEKVELDSSMAHPNPEDPSNPALCFAPADDEMCVVEVTCTPAGLPPQRFTITGGGRDLDTSPPIINFNRNEYRIDTAHFPPEEPQNGNERHGRSVRLVTRLQIFRLVGGARTLVHTCPVIAASGGRSKFIVFDSHKG
jgi:hypothetical protein